VNSEEKALCNTLAEAMPNHAFCVMIGERKIWVEVACFEKESLDIELMHFENIFSRDLYEDPKFDFVGYIKSGVNLAKKGCKGKSQH
jgi:hypothetical protein